MAQVAVANAARFRRRHSGSGTQKKVDRFTRAYESARFGKSVDDAQNLPGLFKEITTAETGDSRKTPDRAAAS